MSGAHAARLGYFGHFSPTPGIALNGAVRSAYNPAMASAPAISGRNIRTLLSLCLVAFALVGSPLLCDGFGVILASGYSLAFAAAIRSIDRNPRERGGEPRLPGVGAPRTKRWVVVIILILVVGALGKIAPLVKQWTLPDYATPLRIETLFTDQLAALRAVAEGKTNSEVVAELFSGNEILEAYVVNSYGDGYGIAADSVKAAAWGTTGGESAWLVADPELTRAVVNIWSCKSGSKAVYERKFRVAGGAVKGYMLAISLDYLAAR